MRPRPFSTAFFLAAAFVALLAGCAGPVGPTVRQDATGQTSTNSPLNKAMFTTRPANPDSPDGEIDTSAFDTVGAMRETVTDEFTVRGGNELRTDQIIQLGAEPRITNISGKDVTIGSLTGNLGKDGTFSFELRDLSTLASAPIRASNEALDRYQGVYAKLTEEQRRVIESANAAWVEAAKSVPAMIAPFKGLVGVP